MAKYRLKANAGPHRGPDGRVYTAGQVVESDTNLAERYREKFEVVDGKQPVFVGPQGGRTGNERPEDHQGSQVFENDQAAAEQFRKDQEESKSKDKDDWQEPATIHKEEAKGKGKGGSGNRR